VSGLYKHVIQTLAHILAYYRQQTFPKAVKVTFSQGAFQKELSVKIEMCKQYSDAVHTETDACHVEMDRETHREVKNGQEIMKAVYEKTSIIEEQVVELRAASLNRVHMIFIGEHRPSQQTKTHCSRC
jgi:hypothetical protein